MEGSLLTSRASTITWSGGMKTRMEEVRQLIRRTRNRIRRQEREFSPGIDHPYLPLSPGRTLKLESEESDIPVTVRRTDLTRTESIGEVTTSVVEVSRHANGVLVERSRDYLAQSKEGDVWCLGQDREVRRDEEIVSHKGSWRATEPGNRPGIFLPASPEVGEQYRQGGAPGVAEEEVLVVAKGETVEVPVGKFENTLRTYTTDPLNPETPGMTTVYAPEVGVIIESQTELVDIQP